MNDEAKENLRGILSMTDEKVADIEAQLQAIASDTVEADEVDEVALEEAVEAAITETVADEATKPETQEATDETATEADESLTLPANYVRSLLATGWSQDDIDSQLSVLGKDFEVVAEKIHENRLRESREWAAHGRIAADQASQVKDGPLDDPNPLEELKRIDVDALKEEFGADENMTALLERIAGPLNKTIEAANIMFPSVAESAARQKQSENAALETEINAFFTSPDLGSYEGLYGKGPMNGVTDQDFQQRLKVMEQADRIRVGASYQGREVGLTEALSLAHDSVSADFTVQAVRKELQAKVLERSKGITSRPTKIETSENASLAAPKTERTRAELEAHAAEALKKVFG